MCGPGPSDGKCRSRLGVGRFASQCGAMGLRNRRSQRPRVRERDLVGGPSGDVAWCRRSLPQTQVAHTVACIVGALAGEDARPIRVGRERQRPHPVEQPASEEACPPRDTVQGPKAPPVIRPASSAWWSCMCCFPMAPSRTRRPCSNSDVVAAPSATRSGNRRTAPASGPRGRGRGCPC